MATSRKDDGASKGLGHSPGRVIATEVCRLPGLRSQGQLAFAALHKKGSNGQKREGWDMCERAVIGNDVLALHSVR